MKAVLVIDMPRNCGDCILANEDYDVCQATQKSISYDKRGYGLECPLKPFPAKMSATANANLDLIANMSREESKIYNVGYTQGRNTCIDEIIGKEKQNGKK